MLAAFLRYVAIPGLVACISGEGTLKLMEALCGSEALHCGLSALIEAPRNTSTPRALTLRHCVSPDCNRQFHAWLGEGQCIPAAADVRAGLGKGTGVFHLVPHTYSPLCLVSPSIEPSFIFPENMPWALWIW